MGFGEALSRFSEERRKEYPKPEGLDQKTLNRLLDKIHFYYKDKKEPISEAIRLAGFSNWDASLQGDKSGSKYEYLDFANYLYKAELEEEAVLNAEPQKKAA